jgi:hypothetical protein
LHSRISARNEDEESIKKTKKKKKKKKKKKTKKVGERGYGAVQKRTAGFPVNSCYRSFWFVSV